MMRIGADQGDPIILALENFVGMLRSHLSDIPTFRPMKFFRNFFHMQRQTCLRCLYSIEHSTGGKFL